MRDCLLSLLAKNRSYFPFIGLDKSEDLVALNPNYFPCCDGSGLQLVADGDVRRCQLMTRYNRLRAVLNLFLNRWGSKHRLALHKMIRGEDLTRLRNINDSKDNAGRMLTSSNRGSPSYLWIVAIVAVWRFGFNVHLVTLDMKSKAQLLPIEHHPRLIVLIENLCSPWQPENMIDCETIINYCHDTMTPLWVDYLKDDGQQKVDGTTATSQVVQEKIAELRDKKPHLYLSKRGQSKLAEVMNWVV